MRNKQLFCIAKLCAIRTKPFARVLDSPDQACSWARLGAQRLRPACCVVSARSLGHPLSPGAIIFKTLNRLSGLSASWRGCDQLWTPWELDTLGHPAGALG